MKQQEFENLLMAHLDGELNDRDERRLLDHMEQNAEARQTFEAMHELQEVHSAMTLKEPTEQAWKQFEQGITHKLLYRPLHVGGMLAVVVGILILAGYGVFELLGLLLGEQDLPIAVRIGGSAVITGLLAMFASVAIGRCVTLPKDKYHQEVDK